jgi:hypothetical protein
VIRGGQLALWAAQLDLFDAGLLTELDCPKCGAATTVTRWTEATFDGGGRTVTLITCTRLPGPNRPRCRRWRWIDRHPAGTLAGVS